MFSRIFFLSFFYVQRINDISVQHEHEIRQLLENKLQYIFSQVRDEYEQQCAHLMNSIERDINQMNTILQDVSNKFDSSTLITNDSTSFLIKKLQHIDVINKNLEYDWQIMTESGSKIFKKTSIYRK